MRSSRFGDKQRAEPQVAPRGGNPAEIAADVLRFSVGLEKGAGRGAGTDCIRRMMATGHP